MNKLTVGAGLMVAVWLAAMGCGGSGTNGSGGSTAQGGAPTGGSTGAGGQVGVGCDPPCGPDKVCSVVGTCIDPGTCAAHGDCDEPLVCDPDTSSCVPGEGCGAEEVHIEPIAPNMLVQLDRSCSMQDKVGGKTKWQIAVAALDLLLTSQADKIRFGLALFPDTVKPNCEQGAIPIGVAEGNEAAIKGLLGAALALDDPYYPDGPCVTPIDTAVEQAATEPAFADPTRKSYVLLITDGKQASCSAAGGAAGAVAIVGKLFAEAAVATFVVGFGDGVNQGELNELADAGGVPTGDPDVHYYQAEDQPSLEAALGTIAKETLGCDFALASEPPDGEKIYVFFNNQPTPVPEDDSHTDGWDYDPATNTVTFYGPTCEALTSGEVTDVDVVFGCPGPTPD